MASQFHLLLVTDRGAVRAVFVPLQEQAVPGWSLTHIPMAADLPADCYEATLNATAALIDVAPDPVAAIQLGQRLRSLQPNLPLVALVCCSHAITPWHVRALTACGVSSLLDLHGTLDEILLALRSAARGGVVLRLHLSREQNLGASDVLSRRVPTGGRITNGHFCPSDMQILELTARGLSDREIGVRLHLSRHTVKHRIERLRVELGTRNRTELAAWAGQQGLYRPSELERVQSG
ncbi:MAG TPA: LuxR C-terminal-related transcriptional regulator [Chloroflexota bacterium]|jgi:DNA-binding NarL/FixJ family response regulator|nr:LuxR C-terminal-related transcriptional regulator [Chloroflexota bacterium]